MAKKPIQRYPLRAATTHVIRTCLVVALLLAIPKPAQRTTDSAGLAPSIDAIEFPPDLASKILHLDLEPDTNEMWRVLDESENTVGLVARTLPAAKDVIGYRGPTEALLLFTPELQLKSVTLLKSADTEEHVAAVKADRDFFRQFEAWDWGGPEADTRIDAVSGATLTSLALAEGIIKRIGGERPSLVFSKPITLDEILDWFPEASNIDGTSGKVRDTSGKWIGTVLRTGPLSDDLSGYQGPTELLLRIDTGGKVDGIRIRASYDNEPYVDYVRTEAGFWAIFENLTIAELSEFDPQAAGVEGVSGATMTSLAVADTLVEATRRAQQQQATSPTAAPIWSGSIRWTTADVITILTILLAVMLKYSGAFRNRTFRRVWLIWVATTIGIWLGNLLSMALVAGWSAEGIAWRLAPGLAAIACVAMLGPPLTKSNPYCNHLCPHGAIQQLIRPHHKSGRYRKLKPNLSRFLRYVPGLTLCIAYIALVMFPSIDLASWEPFHAYLFRITGWGSLVFAFATLAISAVLPMGYCRFGCPTGRLLDYLKRTARSDRLQVGDAVASSLLVFALLIQYWQ